MVGARCPQDNNVVPQAFRVRTAALSRRRPSHTSSPHRWPSPRSDRIGDHERHLPFAVRRDLIDPAGFALENLDAIGRWRDRDDSWNPIDTGAVLRDGSRVADIEELKRALVAKPERFATTIAERLLSYALGRGLEPYDAPSVRKIVSEAAQDGYRVQSLIVNVAQSYPFVMRRSSPTTP